MPPNGGEGKGCPLRDTDPPGGPSAPLEPRTSSRWAFPFPWCSGSLQARRAPVRRHPDGGQEFRRHPEWGAPVLDQPPWASSPHPHTPKSRAGLLKIQGYDKAKSRILKSQEVKRRGKRKKGKIEESLRGSPKSYVWQSV